MNKHAKRINRRLGYIPFLFVLSFLAILTCLFVAPNTAFADEEDNTVEIDPNTNSVRSFQKDFFMGLLYKKLGDGKSFFDLDGSETAKRKEINKAIAEENASQTYSLFDRFGDCVYFEMYLGEEPVKTGLADKIYTAVVQDLQGDFTVSDALELIAQQDANYTDTYYQGRPLLKTDGTDPRVEVYKNFGGITIREAQQYAVANYLLGTAKVIVSIVSYLASGKYVSQIAQVLTDIVDSQQYKAVSSLLTIVIALASVTLAIFLIKHLLGYMKGQKGSSLTNMVVSLIGCGLSLGLILCLIGSPKTFINLSQKILSIGDTLTAQSLNDANANDEIVASDSLDNVVQAALWEEAIFKPWVVGTFGGVGYDELYTTYSNAEKTWDVSDGAAASYGNISVPRSNDQAADVKNWAALAYSCQSIFHLDATADKQDTSKEFPIASFAGQSRYLYEDDFRWIDAAYKTGQYASAAPNKNLDRYVNGRKFNFCGLEQGYYALWLSILLVPIGVLGIKKLSATIKSLGLFATFLYRSCLNVVLPAKEEYNVLSNIKNCFKPILLYFFYTVLVIVSISFYKGFGTGNFLLQILYLCLAIYMCFLRPEDIVGTYKKAKGLFSDIKEDGSARIQNIKQKFARTKISELRNKAANLPLTTQEAEQRIETKNAERDLENAEEQLKDAKKRNEENPTHENKLAVKAAEKQKQKKEMLVTSKSYQAILNEKQRIADAKYRNRDQLSKKELKQLMRDYKKIRREKRANKLQDISNRAFNNTKGGSIIPPIVKMYVLIGLVFIWIAGLFITAIIGI